MVNQEQDFQAKVLKGHPKMEHCLPNILNLNVPSKNSNWWAFWFKENLGMINDKTHLKNIKDDERWWENNKKTRMPMRFSEIIPNGGITKTHQNNPKGC